MSAKPMYKLAKLSGLNVLRNKRRSILTIIIIIVSFSVLSVFAGYINSQRTSWREILIHNDYGHIQIFNKDYFEDDNTSLEHVISQAEFEKVSDILNNIKNIQYFTPRLNISGLIGNENSSKIFIGSARSPTEEEKLFYFSPVKDGEYLTDEQPYGILVGFKLSKRLKVNIGDQVMLMANSSQGSIEAIQARIIGLLRTYSPLDEMAVYLRLEDVPDLILTKSYHNIVLLLDSYDSIPEIKEILELQFARHKLPLVVKDFEQNATFFVQVVEMYESYFNISLIVLSILIIFSLINTIFMSITDRTKEFSTMKTIGISNRTIFVSIIFEGIFIALFGIVFGLILAYFLQIGINSFNLTLPPPPGSEDRIPFMTVFDLLINLKIAAFFIFTAILASIFPAYSVIKMNILKGLHND